MREIDPILADALANQKGELILRVLTWADKAAYDAAPAAPYHTWVVKAFDIEATSATAELVTENDYTVSAFTVFIIERGVKLDGIEHTVRSGLYFVIKYQEDYGAIKLEGSSYPKQKISIVADGTYQEVIEAFCAEIGKTAVFKNPSDTWLEYQFFPDGKILTLNKAEQFENLLKQKYTILVYEESPCNLVFYTQDSAQAGNLKAIATDQTSLVVVGNNGSFPGQISTDAAAWTPLTMPAFYNDVIYCEDLSLWVAVGASAAATSADGVNWTERTIPAGDYNSIAWSPALNLFAAVGDQVCATSPDGTTWTARAIFPDNWKSVTYSNSISLFVAVGKYIATSATADDWILRHDLISFLANYQSEKYAWERVCWSEELGIFVAITPIYPPDGQDTIRVSHDGINWSSYAGKNIYVRDITWSPELGLFVAIGNGIMYSSTGTGWTKVDYIYGDTVCWSPELGIFTTGRHTSTNGISWYDNYPSIDKGAICWSAELGIFVGVDNSKIYTSTDGVNWTERHSRTATYYPYAYSIAWSPELELFISGYASGYSTSPDGITWTDVTNSTLARSSQMLWLPDEHLFISINGGSISASADAVNWNSKGASRCYSVAYSPSLRLFCAVNNYFNDYHPNDLYNRVKLYSLIDLKLNAIISNGSFYSAVGDSICLTSTDAITWTPRTFPTSLYFGLCFGNSLYLAVGQGVIALSSDSITWTAYTTSLVYNWVDVLWSTALNLFIAVANNGALNNIMFSSDGIIWTPISSGSDFNLSYLDGKTSYIIRDQSKIHYLWRDEASSTHTSGDTDLPQWNLGYLPSTALPPATREDAYYKIFLQKAPVRLDITDSDKVHFSPYWSVDPTQTIDAMMQVTEHLNLKKAPAWYQEIKSIILFNSTEGGALPSTIERVAAYTPLVSTGFDGNLTPAVNNLQALAQAIDDMPLGAFPEAPADSNYYARRNSAWTNIKTFFDTIYQAIGSYISDAASDSVYYGRRNGAWTNLKTYFDTIYFPAPATTALNDFQLGDGSGKWIKKSYVQTKAILNPGSTYAASGGTTTLTNASEHFLIYHGTLTHTVKLPSTSTMQIGETFTIYNLSSYIGGITIKANDDSTIRGLLGGFMMSFICISQTDNTNAAWIPLGQVSAGDQHDHGGTAGGGGTINYASLQGAPGVPDSITDLADVTDFSSFTPAVAGTTTAGTGTYTSQLGRYMKLGRVVFVEMELIWTAHTGAGNLRINGLPATVANSGINIPLTVYWSSLTLSAVGDKVFVNAIGNSTYCLAYKISGAAASQLALDTAGTIVLSGFYFASG